MEKHVQLVLKLDTRNPIEIEDFIAAFTSLSNQFERFVSVSYPDLSADAKIYVRQIRSGSIIADLLPWALATMSAATPYMSQLSVLEDFVVRYGNRLSTYFKKDGRVAEATKSDLNIFADCVAAVANDPEGSVTIEAAYYEDGNRDVRAAFTFNTKEGQAARREIEAHKIELDKRDSADHERVLMTYSQSNVKDTKVGTKTSERVVIESISSRDLPIVYASDLAEQRIKHEIRETAGNIYKKAFDVDVNVELLGGIPRAYRIVHVHDVIALSDDE